MGMGRGRLKMELIANERSRKTTFQKRRRGIMKKAYEFSTLCEVDMCMIIYGPKLADRAPELQTWPENPADVSRIIDRYKANTMGRPAKKTFDLSDLLTLRKNKVHADIYRKRKEMYDAKYPTWDDRINNFSENQLEMLLGALDVKLESAKRTLFNKKNMLDCPSHNLVMEKAAPKKVFLGGNYPRNAGEPSSQKLSSNYYMPEQKPMSSMSANAVDILQPFDHLHLHHQPSDHHQMLQFDNHSEQYLNKSHLLAPNPGPMAMWMMMESNYNYSLQLRGGASSSSSNSQSPPLMEGYQSNFNEPIGTMHENMNMNMNMNTNMMMMMNNGVNIPPPASSSPMSGYYSRLMQPAATVPYMPMQYPIMMATPSSSSHHHHHHHQAQVHVSQSVRDDQRDNQYLVMNDKMA